MSSATAIEADVRIEHLSDAEIAGFLDGDLSAGERRRAEAHLEGCVHCRAAMTEVMRIADTAPSPITAPSSAEPVIAAAPVPSLVQSASAPGRAGTRVNWRFVSVASAAALVGILLFRPESTSGPSVTPADVSPVASVTRGERGDSVAVLEPQFEVAGRVTFRWRAASAANAYVVTLQSSNGSVLWSERTTDTVITLPADLSLDPGAYFWRVDGVAAGITSTSGARRFIVDDERASP